MPCGVAGSDIYSLSLTGIFGPLQRHLRARRLAPESDAFRRLLGILTGGAALMSKEASW